MFTFKNIRIITTGIKWYQYHDVRYSCARQVSARTGFRGTMIMLKIIKIYLKLRSTGRQWRWFLRHTSHVTCLRAHVPVVTASKPVRVDTCWHAQVWRRVSACTGFRQPCISMKAKNTVQSVLHSSRTTSFVRKITTGIE